MKRSQSIRLVLLGSAGLLALSGCDQGPDPLARNDFFQSEQQCASVANPDACRQALADARAEHQRTAPAFTSREACEARFGAESCTETTQPPLPAQLQDQPGGQQTAQSGGSWFLPVMLGYMMGRTTSGFTSQPVYRDANNTVYSGRQALGQTRIMPPPKAAPSSVARGGFGRTGTGFGTSAS